MDHYFKTDLGIQALKQRSFQLNARQRQLLLLIGTDDFKILNSALKQRLATPELLQQLEDLGLIFQNKINRSTDNSIHSVHESKQVEQSSLPTDTATVQLPSEIILNKAPAETQNSTITVSHQLIENTHQTIAEPPIQPKVETVQPELVCISFEEIKQKMMSSLQTHCGLMGKQLILKIQQATSVRDIKFCQMQWITALQESRISPLELNNTMQQINHSLQHLQSS